MKLKLGDNMSKKLTKLQTEEIINKYKTENYTCKKLGEEYNKTLKCICYLLKRNNIIINNNQSELQRKYSLNEHYFDIIDTEEKAYFLGLLYADGCNYLKENHISLSLQENDKKILEKFNTAINSNRPLSFKEDKRINNRKNSFILSINNKYMSQQLTKQGCVPVKSLILKFPTQEQVSPDLIRHFVRGYFDGDGSINITKGGRNKKSDILQVNIVSTIFFVNELKFILKEKLDIHCCISHDKRVINKSTRSLCISCNVARKFLNWIYENSTIYLDRKFNKYQEFLKIK